MKVLMLGWEFPPHISGGLGTACAGLTHALEQEQVDVLFVVPKLHGGERAEKTSFIDASSIPIRQKKIIVKEAFEVSCTEKNAARSLPADNLHSGTRTTIEVSSFLMPYTTPDHDYTTGNLQHWNYSFTTEGANSTQTGTSTSETFTRTQTKYAKQPFQFSGSYGSNLLEEVTRYGQVAAEIARRNSFDVIHAHDWMTYKAGIAAKKVSGKPLIVHVHATEVDRSGANVNHEIFQIEREGLIHADKVVSVSQWTKNILVKNYQIAGEKIEVVHNGINPKASADVRATTPPLGAQIVTFLGRITHQKGPMYFVEAARKVHEQFPEVHFVVAGAGDQLPAMIERIAQLRMSNNFHFTGFLKGDDIDRIWAMSTVYVMPSVSEPFGIAPLEAVQAGVPVILSKQAGVSEVMPDAIKVDFWDTEAFAEAIGNLLRFRSLVNTLRKNGSEEIKKITWNKAAKKLTTLYYELTSKHAKPEERTPVLSSPSAKKTTKTPVL